MKYLTILFMTVTTLGIAASSDASVILEDNFNRTDSNLIGDTPSTPQNAGDTWSADVSTPAWDTDGSQLVMRSGSFDRAAGLPLDTSSVGDTIAASVDFEHTGSGDWIGVGLGDTDFVKDDVGPWMLLNSNGAVTAFAQDDSGARTSVGSGTFTTSETLKITYDFSTETAEYFVGTTSLGSFDYDADGTNFVPNIDRVGLFSKSGSPAMADNLRVVPEPASLAMGLVGFGALALRRRRRA